MKANIKQIRKIRRYSKDFKKSIVADYESGKFSVLQLERLHGVNNVTIYRWIYQFSTFNENGYRVVEKKLSSEEKLKNLERKVKDLEAALGRKQIKIDYLETMMEVAKRELDIDIKKNFGTSQSKSSSGKE